MADALNLLTYYSRERKRLIPSAWHSEGDHSRLIPHPSSAVTHGVFPAGV